MEAYDPGNNMGNATYDEMYIAFVIRRDKLTEEIRKLLTYKKQEGDVWDRQAEKTRKVLNELPKFGYDTIDYNNDYYYLYNDRVRLERMFRYKFGRMRIAYNTPTEFNYQLQAIFDNIADKYNNQLAIIAAYRKEFYDDSGPTKGKIRDDIDYNDLAKNDLFTYPHEKENKKHITTNETRQLGIKNKMSNLTSIYNPFSTVIKNYLNEYYSLFDTIEYATGGYVID